MPDHTKRRQFLKLAASTALSAGFTAPHARAEDPVGALYQRIVPSRKGLDAKWALSLAKRGAERDAGITASDKKHLGHIGMTVGGIGCGTVYLTGDGRLFVWDIFHQPHSGVVAQQVEVPHGFENIGDSKKKVRENDGANYLRPPTPESHPNPFQQGFSLVIDGAAQPRPIDATGWDSVKFTGRWPLGTVDYAAADCPLAVKLEAWTPFIPMETTDSSLPVTVMEFTLENRSGSAVGGRLAGVWENPVYCHSKRSPSLQVASRVIKENGLTMLAHEPVAGNEQPSARPDILFDDFEREGHGDWLAEGTAFGEGPIGLDRIPGYQGRVGARGNRLINSHASAPGADDVEKDRATGTLTSREFMIERKFIRMLLGGGKRPRETGVEILVDGQVVASATGENNNRMGIRAIDVAAFEGKQARLRLVDRAADGWGNVGADHIVFTDMPDDPDASGKPGDHGTAVLAFSGAAEAANGAMDSLVARFKVPAGGKQTLRFFLCWHFPNMRELPGVGIHVPHYTTRHADAVAVARDVGNRIDALRQGTMRWVATWNDSTLPQWLLDRSILTTNTLQTTNCHMLGKEGRFWAWEGVGCCAGTCAHVWHYAQGVARLFPDIERNLREVTDYGVAMNDDGSIRFRAEANKTVALDSQTGILLRTWREHLCSTGNDFLKRVWPGARRALEWLIRFDADGRGGLDGLLDGKQHNTLDAEWYGKVHCLCSLYLASLRAGEEMAKAVGETAFASTCAAIHAMGVEKIRTLFNGEFYIQEEDPAHDKAIGVGAGCYIDQVIGQWWATQVGLGRLYDAAHIRSALHSLWRYNFVPEIGSFRRAFKQGRFYAMPGDAGLVMCTWPKGGLREDFKNHWQYAYFNECMSGFEWQVAAHMVQEGEPIAAGVFDKIVDLLEDANNPRSLTARGLAVGRAIHDRYAPSLRNPYNEIECSDHYARANASYSLFLAACGFEYDGPAGVLGFAPKLTPEDFKAAFTAAAGWGSFAQKKSDAGWRATITLAHGGVSLSELRLPWLAAGARARLGQDDIAVTVQAGKLLFAKRLQLNAGSPELTVTLA